MAALALLGAPRPAPAACPVDGIAGGVAVRIDPSALRVLEAALPDLLPEELAVPDEPYTAFSCSGAFEDTVLTPRGARAALRDVRAHLRLADGGIEVEGTLDVEVTGALEMQLCALPNAVCPARVVARGVAIRGRLEPRLESCSPVTPLTGLELVADPASTIATLEDCEGYDYEELWDAIYDWFGEAILATLTEAVLPLVRDELPSMLEAFTAELIAGGGSMAGLELSAVPERLDVSADGVTLVFTADVLPAAGPASCLPTGSSLPVEDYRPASPPRSDAMVSLAVSRPLAQRAVRAAWLAGWLCYDSRDYDLDLGTPLQMLAPGVEVGAQLVVETPPAVAWAPATAGGQVSVSATGVRVDVRLESPGQPPASLQASLDLALTGEAVIDPRVQALVVRPLGATSRGAVVTAPGARLALSAGTLQALVDNSLLPAFAGSLARLPLLGNLLSTAPVAVRVDGVAVAGEDLRADLELWPRDPRDREPPETVVETAPPFPAPAVPEVRLGSWDEGTPARFLRHRVTVDGVTDEDWYGGTEVRLTGLAHGPHDVSLQAVDLNDNADPTPETLSVFVDDQPPAVSLQPQPGLLRERRASFTVTASDETTPAAELMLGYDLTRLAPDGGADLPVERGAVPSGGRLRLEGLPEDVVLRLTAHATDAAGNRGEAVVAFVVNAEPTLGCRVAPASGEAAAAGPLLLLLLAAAAHRRRPGRSR